MKAGLTGSTGVLGKILNTKLNELGHQVFPFTFDIRDKEALNDWVMNDFEVIFHLAAMVPVNLVATKPLDAFSINVGGTINLLESVCALNSKYPWLFFASSAHIYKSSNNAVNENSPIEPITLYGETKWIAERICSEVTKAKKIPFCSGRIFSYYHETQKKPFLYPSIIERIKTEDLTLPFELYGADSIRDFLNAEEIVEIVIKLMNNRVTGIFNIASGKGIKIRDFVQQLSEKALIIENADSKKDCLYADITKLNKVLES
jgi:nucleoside-diphosphate-sugar epimerase